jgi:hypothetical protein
MFTSELKSMNNKEADQLRNIYARSLFNKCSSYFFLYLLFMFLVTIFLPAAVVHPTTFWSIEITVAIIGAVFSYYRIKKFISTNSLRKDLNNNKMQVLYIRANAVVSLSTDHGYNCWFMKTGVDEYVLVSRYILSYGKSYKLDIKKFPCDELTILRYPCSGLIVNINYRGERLEPRHIDILEGVSDECSLLDLPALELLSGSSGKEVKALFEKK